MPKPQSISHFALGLRVEYLAYLESRIKPIRHAMRYDMSSEALLNLITKQLGEFMPEKKVPNIEMCTASEAIAIYNKFVHAGVPVSNLLENNLTAGEVAVLNNPNFEDDGGQHQYLMNIWGKQMVVSLADQYMKGVGGIYECLVRLASVCVVNSSSNLDANLNQPTSLTFQQAEEVVFGLPGFAARLDAAINYK